MKIFFALMPLTLAWAVNLGSDKKRPATPIDELPGKVPDQDVLPDGYVMDEFWMVQLKEFIESECYQFCFLPDIKDGICMVCSVLLRPVR